MDLRSILEKIGDLSTEQISESTKETGTGRVHKGKYGTSYQPDEKRDEYGHKIKGTKSGPDIDSDEEEKEDKPAKRGRGRPTKAGSKADTATKYSGAQELQRWIVGSVPKKSKELDKLPSKKHKLKDWIEHVETEMLAESQQIDEVSREKLQSYKTKASDARTHKELSTAKVDKRYAGVKKASDRLEKKNKESQQDVEEGIIDNVAKGIKRAIAGKSHPKVVQQRYYRLAQQEKDAANRFNSASVLKDRDNAINRLNKINKIVDKQDVSEGGWDGTMGWEERNPLHTDTLDPQSKLNHKKHDDKKDDNTTDKPKVKRDPPGTRTVPGGKVHYESKQSVKEAAPITIKPATQKQTQVVQQGDNVIAQVDNPALANQIKQAVGKGELKFDGEDKLEEKKMTSAHRAKEKRLKSKYDDSEMKASMIKQYGPEKGEDVYFATIRKQAMKESTKNRIDEGYQLDEIISRFPHEHKNCQEGHDMDQAMFEALRDHYFESGRIPHGIARGELSELKQWVHECYMEDTHQLMEEPIDEAMKDYDLPPGTRNRPVPTLQSTGTSNTMTQNLVPQQQSNREMNKDNLNKEKISNLERSLTREFLDDSMEEDYAMESKFGDLKSKLSKKQGVKDPAALAAWIGREKLGQKEMTKRSVQGRKKATESMMESQEFSNWDKQLSSLLSEGLTITTSSGQGYGPGGESQESVSVNATDEDAKVISDLLKNAGIGLGSKSASDEESMDHEHSVDDSVMSHGGIEVTDASSVMDKLMGSEEEVDNSDSIISLIKKMNVDDSSEHKETDVEPADDHLEDPDSKKDTDEDDKEETKEAVEQTDENAFSYAAAQAAKAGKKEFEFGGKKHPVTMNKKTADKIDEQEVEESKEMCSECGSAMTEGHECDKEQVEEADETQINEWANTPQNKEDETFVTEMDYMLKMLSGGLNGPKKDNSVSPKQQQVIASSDEDIDQWKRLAGIK